MPSLRWIQHSLRSIGLQSLHGNYIELFIYKHGYDSKKMINVITYLYQHTTHPFCLQTAGVRPITSQRFGDIDDKNRTCSISDNFCCTINSCTTFNVTHAIKIVRYCRSTISYDFYRSSDISFIYNLLFDATHEPLHMDTPDPVPLAVPRQC